MTNESLTEKEKPKGGRYLCNQDCLDPVVDVLHIDGFLSPAIKFGQLEKEKKEKEDEK